MEAEKTIRKFQTVYSELQNKCLHTHFTFPGGGKVLREMGTFIQKMKGEFGDISDERIVDYCVALVHFWKDNDKYKTTIRVSFGPKAIERYKGFNKGKRYYEDRWLADHRLTRGKLLSLITDNSKHPLSDYVYIEGEDETKERAARTGLYIGLCMRSTLMWSPFSPACQKCGESTKCEEVTKAMYPELHRIRVKRWLERK